MAECQHDYQPIPGPIAETEHALVITGDGTWEECIHGCGAYRYTPGPDGYKLIGGCNFLIDGRGATGIRITDCDISWGSARQRRIME